MKKTYCALMALSASAELVSASFYEAKPFKAPATTNNVCNEKQSSGFDWSDLDLGSFDRYADFEFKGFSASTSSGLGKGYKRDALTGRSAQDKVITGKACDKKEDTPQFGLSESSSIKDFSIDSIQMSTEFDCELQFEYKMPDLSTCRHKAPCKKDGCTVKNEQCGGAIDIAIIFPLQTSGPGVGKEECEIGIEKINYNCENGEEKTKEKAKEKTKEKEKKKDENKDKNEEKEKEKDEDKDEEKKKEKDEDKNEEKKKEKDEDKDEEKKKEKDEDKNEEKKKEKDEDKDEDKETGYPVQSTSVAETTTVAGLPVESPPVYTPQSPAVVVETTPVEGYPVESTSVSLPENTPIASYPVVVYPVYPMESYPAIFPDTTSVEKVISSSISLPETTPVPGYQMGIPPPQEHTTSSSLVVLGSTTVAGAPSSVVSQPAMSYPVAVTSSIETSAPASVPVVPVVTKPEYAYPVANTSSSSVETTAPVSQPDVPVVTKPAASYPVAVTSSNEGLVPSSAPSSSLVTSLPHIDIITVVVSTSTTICPVTLTQVTSGTTAYEVATTTSYVLTTVTSTICTKCQAPTSPPVAQAPSPVVTPSGTTTAPISVETAPCPEVLPSCMNTWLFEEACESNTDAACYCPSENFVTKVFDCLSAHAADDNEMDQAQKYFQGICAPHIPTNPAIVTAAPPVDVKPLTTPYPVISTPVTTIVVSKTVVVPCVVTTGPNSGSTIPSTSTTMVISTVLTVPEVVFVTLPPSGTPTPGGKPVPGVPVLAVPTAPIYNAVPPQTTPLPDRPVPAVPVDEAAPPTPAETGANIGVPVGPSDEDVPSGPADNKGVPAAAPSGPYSAVPINSVPGAAVTTLVPKPNNGTIPQPTVGTAYPPVPTTPGFINAGARTTVTFTAALGAFFAAVLVL